MGWIYISDKMEKREKTKLGLFLLFGIMVFSVIPLISPAYISSNSRYTQPGMSSYSYLAGKGIDIYPQLDPEKCGAGQDFLIQISPIGCSQSVVRSDLLEEQNVAVFCPLMATKLNPLIDVKAINNINFRDYPQGVSGIGFHPAQSALSIGYRTMLNSPVLENIGYAVIVLQKQKNESSMPDYVEGTVTANIRYDIQNAFGTGRSVYYLPILEDDEWEENYQQYSFWKGKGYLRADAVGLDDARISIYRDQDTVLSVKNIQEGETTPETVYIPGYYCLAGVQLRLDGLESYDTFAKISIDGEYYELKDGERFLDNKCEVRDLQKQGLNEKVKIYCDVDEGQRNFELNIIPQITLNVNGVEKSYTIGDKIATSDESNKDIYLGAAYTYHDSGKLNDLRLYFIKAPIHDERLNDGDINSVYSLSKNFEVTSTGFIPRDVLFSVLKTYLGAGKLLYNWLIEGETFYYMEYGASSRVWGSEISVIGFSQPSDLGINEDFQENFDNAESNYLEIIEDYSGEKIQGTEETYSEKDLIELIKMSWVTEQGKTMLEYCDLFKTKYPDSVAEVAEYCDNSLKISSSEISTQDVVVDGEVRLFSFEGIKEPGFEEYGATVSVSGAAEGYNGEKKLKKNEVVYVSEDEFFQLTKVEEDYIEIRTEVKVPALRDNPKTVKIELNDYSVLADKYNIHLDDINLKKVAKVSLIPNIKYSETTANFSFKIGIEKRGIQLTPEEVKSKIEKIDDQISKWEDISNTLANTVKTMKTACLGTGAFLTLTNFLADSKGTALARQRVMRSDGGWYDYCVKEVEAKTYSSIDACLLDKADEIDKDVETMTSVINSQNEKIKDIQTYRDAPLGGKVVDEEKFVQDYSKIVRDKIPSDLQGINTSVIENSLNVAGWQNGNFYKDDLRDIELYSDILDSGSSSPELKEIARRELTTTLTRVQENSEQDFQLNTLSTKWNTRGFSNLKADAYGSKDSKVIKYDGDVAPAGNSLNLEAGTPVQLITYNNNEYLLSLNAISADSYAIDSIYDSNGVKVENSEIRSSFSKLQSFDKNTYKNPYSNAEVKYFETGEYKGWPSIVPFNTQDGWYVAVRQTLPGLGNIRAYDESGRVASFWVGNVGKNGRQQFNEQSSDDIIMQFNPGTGEIYGTFPGLDESDTRKLVQDAVNAVSDAQRAYKSGVKNVRINGQSITVGTPSVNVPEVQCQDFMSPTDCNLLFNICDPVVCPSSRCNLGGNYYVDDVIQTGIIGGIALCLPNYREGIAIPICLSGINAGVESLLSVAHSYRDCLQESLDTGEQVGICDYINSIYLCEFFWREATPFVKAGIPSLLSWISGQGARGGGEYMALTSAYDNAVSSVDYFVNYYGENSYNAFKARSTDEVGSEVCKNSLSVKYPTSADLIDALTEPDSPVQYTAWFEEIPFTTATNPPISQYKIFYHIYAGKDIGHYYRVYLKSPTGFSLYQESSSVIIAQGYVGVGEYATETKDLTASSGYKELCINIDGQDDCGFAEVSTSFASDYISDKYIEEQTTREVTSESECISGSPSWYGLLNANVEEGVSEALNPELYNKGIVRVCSSANPGQGTDENRWTKVGYCTDKNTGCWLDTQSVKDTVSIKSIEEGILDETTENYLDALRQEGGYYTEEEANSKIVELREKVGNSMERGIGTTNSDELIQAITEINSAYEKVLLSNEKVQLIDLRARAYNKLARNIFGIWQNSLTKITDTGRISDTMPTQTQAQPASENIINDAEKILGTDFLSRIQSYQSLIEEASSRYGVSQNLIKAIIRQESNAQRDVTDGLGSYGLMQVSEVAAQHVKNTYSNSEHDQLYSNFIRDHYHSEANIKLGTAYYKILEDYYRPYNSGENIRKISLAAYNWGIGNIDKNCEGKKWENCKNIPSVVINYVDSVLSFEKAISEKSTIQTESISSGNADLIENVELMQIVKWGKDNKLDYILLPPQDTTVLRIYLTIDEAYYRRSPKTFPYNLVLKDNFGKELINIDRISAQEDFIFILKDGDFNLFRTAASGDVYGYEITVRHGEDYETVVGQINILATAGSITQGGNEAEINNIKTATKCGDCGKGLTNICDEKECLSIAEVLHEKDISRYCAFEDKSVIPGGSCIQLDYSFAGTITQGGYRYDINNIASATKCSDCGNGELNVCDERECLTIGDKISRTCKIEDINHPILRFNCIDVGGGPTNSQFEQG